MVACLAFVVNGIGWPDSPSWEPGYDHDRYAPNSYDLRFDFLAFTLSFDGSDNDDGRPGDDLLGVAEWVAYELRGSDDGSNGSCSWSTDSQLASEGIAPRDATYGLSRNARNQLPPNFNYVRGHLIPREDASRISETAECQTYTLLNAVPQVSSFNGGEWADLEEQVRTWAAAYDKVWVVTGLIFADGIGSLWFGEPGRREKLAAVPHYLFKVVFREVDNNTVAVIGFVYPNDDDLLERANYIHPLREIQAQTDLNFRGLIGKTILEGLSHWD